MMYGNWYGEWQVKQAEHREWQEIARQQRLAKQAAVKPARGLRRRVTNIVLPRL